MISLALGGSLHGQLLEHDDGPGVLYIPRRSRAEIVPAGHWPATPLQQCPNDRYAVTKWKMRNGRIVSVLQITNPRSGEPFPDSWFVDELFRWLGEASEQDIGKLFAACRIAKKNTPPV